ncbi:ribonuclease H family protein [Methylobacter sp.]|uniref:ribonuclease H family protein n=1 Tax=Methylobacter sp. TaxID=2051955 RepID=UPI003DA62A79
MKRQNQAQQHNEVVDNALLAPTDENREQLRLLAKAGDPGPLAERIRRRATLLARRRSDDPAPLLRLRDELILTVYAAVAPKGWSCGWADGASFKTGGRRQAGIGGLLAVSDGTVIEWISRSIGEEDAFAAELAALTAVMQCATARLQKRLWLYTDNRGLVQLWNEHRDDNRLNKLRGQAAGLERFTLRAIPRLHNQPANALARAAVRASASPDPFL